MRKLPSYLGLPLRASCKYAAVWDGVEEQFHKRLLLWKRQHLSKGRRHTLLRSTLASLLIYFISMFTILRIVRLRLKKIQRDFLWKKIMRGKFREEEGDWRLGVVRDSYGVGV